MATTYAADGDRQDDDDARLPVLAALVVVAMVSFLSTTVLWGVVIALVLLGVWR